MSVESRLAGTTHIVTLAGLPFTSPRGIFTTVTRSADMVANWVDLITVAYGVRWPHNPQVVGLVITFQPKLHATGNCSVALLQLCVGSDCLIYQLLHRDAAHPPKLLKFFEDSCFCFVGDTMKESTDQLLSEHGFSVRNTMELVDAVVEPLQSPEMQFLGQDPLMIEVMGAEIDMPEEVLQSSWQQRVLQPQQIAYA